MFFKKTFDPPLYKGFGYRLNCGPGALTYSLPVGEGGKFAVPRPPLRPLHRGPGTTLEKTTRSGIRTVDPILPERQEGAAVQQKSPNSLNVHHGGPGGWWAGHRAPPGLLQHGRHWNSRPYGRVSGRRRARSASRRARGSWGSCGPAMGRGPAGDRGRCYEPGAAASLIVSLSRRIIKLPSGSMAFSPGASSRTRPAANGRASAKRRSTQLVPLWLARKVMGAHNPL